MGCGPELLSTPARAAGVRRLAGKHSRAGYPGTSLQGAWLDNQDERVQVQEGGYETKRGTFLFFFL